MRNSNQIICLLKSFNLFLAENGEQEDWYPQSHCDEEWVNENFICSWEEVVGANNLTRRNWWGSNGYYTQDGFISHKDAFLEKKVFFSQEERIEAFESVGDLVCEVPSGFSYNKSYTEASWYVKFPESWKMRMEIFSILKYQRVPFQLLPKGWKRLFGGMSDEQAVNLLVELKESWCPYTGDYKCNPQLLFIESFLELRQKPKGWEGLIYEFLTMDLQFEEEGKYILFKHFKEERWFWKLVKEVGFKATLSLMNEALQVLIGNEVIEDFALLKLPERYDKAIEAVRKWTHKHEGWHPDDVQEIPLLGKSLQYEGLLVVSMSTTADALAVAHRYGNCLKSYIKKLLRKQLVVFEVINPRTGCTALLGYEPGEGGLWVTKEEFFRGVNDEEVTDLLILEAKSVFDLQINK